MEEFVKGDILILSYPFSDFTSQKRRPALLIASPKGNDIIICQITSQVHYDSLSISLEEGDFVQGSLHQKSYIRPNKLISIDKKLILYKAGKISNIKINEVIDSIIRIIVE